MSRPRRAQNTEKKGKNTKKTRQYVKNDVGTKRAELKIRRNHAQKPNRNDKETEKYIYIYIYIKNNKEEDTAHGTMETKESNANGVEISNM